ncbi:MULTISPECIES: DUF6278 family protein [Streptomyces]|uniref:DUF3806 domain-containing protein n=1 Tax=Streptomyces dengpaensis TaxID=2049881 RepID=A0ABM6SLL4_9ACTN|nr:MULTISPECIES: DUF6278 family protein [Streptomyces]AVH55513.1 hypothetical protein C4B68_06670 [Streptomyces dengpaensis]PIB11779.1 hypothetical protein B1C81_00640 [Streptomyces sp. HG99]
MKLPFTDDWRKRYGPAEGMSVVGAPVQDPEGVAELLSACELLRSRAASAALRLDDSARTLETLDQLLPRRRDDPEELTWLGNDAGLYLGTVIIRTVPGAAWQVWPNGRPVVRPASGREIDVVQAGLDWAAAGAPELSEVYAEASESWQRVCARAPEHGDPGQ